MTTKELVNRFEVGDPLSDKECWELFRFFQSMEEGCKALGNDYGLFLNDMRAKRMKVEGYLDARHYGKR